MRMPFRNLVHETTTTIGTATLALIAAPGYPRFSDVFTANDPVEYSIRNGLNWEVGIGTYLAPNQLARNIVLGTFAGAGWNTDGQPLNLTGTSVVRSVITAEHAAALIRVEHMPTTVNSFMQEGHSYAVLNSALQL